ncbi:hypothetical protein OESDEN_05222 [Oesophagostomum dentatum]|uniref:N-acetyltransferase domain-containing protein n=1 Tax=Oesophagostomum dentatum TaxID=61180 RepID=A0A0B1TB98_OESDE|nr:hypothetical protein OESDEN_05222 [Oesophagostomum dentatum]
MSSLRGHLSPVVYKAIDDLANLSAQCMQLRAPLTCCERLVNSDHTLYLSWEYDEEKNVSRLIGYAKVGRKKLFLYDSEMQTYEGEVGGFALCLLTQTAMARS